MGIFCLMLLVVLYGSVLYTRDNSNVQRMFRWTLLASMATVCSDILWGFTYSGEHGAAVSWTVNIVYTVSESMTYLLWAMHYRASHADFPKGRRLIPWILPPIAAIAMCIASVQTGAYITIDSSGVYSRGPLHGLYTLVVSLPVIVVTLESIWRMARSHRNSEIMREATLAGFILPLVGCAVVQIVWYDVPALAIGLTLSLLVVYINMQNMRITEDPLTGLGNRFRMGTYLESRFDDCRYWGGTLHLAVMDLDHFTATVAANPPGTGDRALAMVARVLRDACEGKGCFIAKYGGDEFLLARDHGTAEEFEAICADVRSGMEELSATLPYDLRLSIGTSQYSGQPSVRAVFDEADAAMYGDKRSHYESQGIRWTR